MVILKFLSLDGKSLKNPNKGNIKMEKEKLMKEWIRFKKAEEKAKKNRIEVEKGLEEIYGSFKGNSKTFNEENGFSVNIKKNVKYSLDQTKWKGIRTKIPENYRPEKISYSLDLAGFNWLKENNNELYLKVSDCVEQKNNKSTITVEKK
jgi:VIT1/CCC1 family predicted Fe2+/Mn2+ transporter